MIKEMDKIIVLDFGSQYSHLICRRIRELSVYAELVDPNISMDTIQKDNVKGIILSGGPNSVYDKGAPIPDDKIFDSKIPILGICYGHQIIVNKFHGEIKRANKEYGSATLTIDDGSSLLEGIGGSTRAWMSHGDEASKIPENFKIIGHTESSKAAAIASTKEMIFGIQFHPEVIHTDKGMQILKNFVENICHASRDWTMKKFVDVSVEEIKRIKGNVLCGVSGGIDSTVTALLIHKAINKRLKCIFVDNGLLRHNEVEEIENMFKDNFNMNFDTINAQEEFLGKLNRVEDPEEKRKIVGSVFVDTFVDFAEKKGPFDYLAQGTLYPDVIESGVSKGPADVIKTHHNVGGLTKKLNLKILEPLRDLYKDEVRDIAKILGVPEKLRTRHPFPGPGLAVRIIGEITSAKLEICRQASNIVEEELRKSNQYDNVWQAFAIVGNDKAVGVVGDKRQYGHIVTIRVVNSLDAMTADWTRLPNEVIERISNRITNEINGVTWVSYVVSSKPPATIEPQ
ncbi:MAG: glutamine-hydrolyzing GMP synthase [Candidatus Nitrosoabyssus spongiisocia]|nr:MAG: glutamine-hydrolyzing GMP synthase [Nitrosopumilaceae archaeon AB1(1)]